jgi:hypothetical protein
MSFQRKALAASVVVVVIATTIGGFLLLKPKASSCRNELKYWPTSSGIGRDVLQTVVRVFDRLGHREAKKDEDWDIMWTYEYPFEAHSEHLKDAKPHQLINHFPGMTFLTNKMFVSKEKSGNLVAKIDRLSGISRSRLIQSIFRFRSTFPDSKASSSTTKSRASTASSSRKTSTTKATKS